MSAVYWFCGCLFAGIASGMHSRPQWAILAGLLAIGTWLMGVADRIKDRNQ